MSEQAKIRPDWECVGCGDEGMGKPPLRCRKCNAVTFKRFKMLGGTPMESVVGAFRRMQEDVADVRAELVKRGHPHARALGLELRRIELAAAKAERVVLGTAERVTRAERAAKRKRRAG